MPAIALQLVKPSRWAISPGLVDPNWRWAWRGLHYGLLLNEGGGDPFPFVGQRLGEGTRTSVVWVPTKYGWALSWNADTDRVVLPNLGMSYWTDFTVTILMKWAASPDVSDACYAYCFQGTSPWGTEVLQWHYNNSVNVWRARVDTYGGTGNYVLLDDSDIDSYKGVWRLVHLTYDGATATLYKDGQYIASGSLSGQLGIRSSNTYELGSRATKTLGFEGEIALFLVHDRALTADEVYRHALDPFGPFRMVDEAGVVYAAGAAPPQTVTPGATPIASGLPSVTAVPGAAVLAPGPALIAAGLPGATVAPGGVTLAASPLSIIAGLPATTAAPGLVTLSPSPVTVAAAIPGAVIVPGAVTVTPSAVSVAALLPDVTIPGGAITVTPSAVTFISQVAAAARTAGVTLYPSAVSITVTPPTPAIVPGSVVATPSAVVLALAVVAPGAFIGAAIIGTISLSGELALVVSLDGESLTAIPLSANQRLSIDLQGEVP